MLVVPVGEALVTPTEPQVATGKAKRKLPLVLSSSPDCIRGRPSSLGSFIFRAVVQWLTTAIIVATNQCLSIYKAKNVDISAACSTVKVKKANEGGQEVQRVQRLRGEDFSRERLSSKGAELQNYRTTDYRTAELQNF